MKRKRQKHRTGGNLQTKVSRENACWYLTVAQKNQNVQLQQVNPANSFTYELLG
jgi:hypothetical protein